MINERPPLIVKSASPETQVSAALPIYNECLSHNKYYKVPHPPPLFPLPSPLSPSQLCGVGVGHKVLSLNGQVMDRPISEGELEVILKPTIKNPPPLHVVLSKNSSEYHTLVSAAGGLGFHIRGSSPVIIDNIDKGMRKAA